MQFAIIETVNGVSRRIGVVMAVTQSGAIMQALRKWPPRPGPDGKVPMLSTERVLVQ